jgi:hypothetical protein
MLEFIVTWTVGLLILANMILWSFVVFIIALPLLIRAVLFMYGFTVGIIEGIRGK